MVYRAYGHLASGKQAEDVAASNRHLSDGYVQLDLIGQRKFGTNVAVNVGVFNITDKEYKPQRLAQTRYSALRSQACTMGQHPG